MPTVYLKYGEIAYIRKLCKNDQISRTTRAIDLKLEAYEKEPPEKPAKSL